LRRIRPPVWRGLFKKPLVFHKVGHGLGKSCDVSSLVRHGLNLFRDGKTFFRDGLGKKRDGLGKRCRDQNRFRAGKSERCLKSRKDNVEKSDKNPGPGIFQGKGG
jgi:hypothetical protein